VLRCKDDDEVAVHISNCASEDDQSKVPLLRHATESSLDIGSVPNVCQDCLDPEGRSNYFDLG
jgi:hypothetical protein